MPCFLQFQPVAVFPKVFVSYCWTNSHDAVKKGTKEVKGSLGFYDPRHIKEYLEEKGMSVWMDIDKVAQVKCEDFFCYNHARKRTIKFGDLA